jgi:DNA-binding response OmpR family regulator
MEVDIPLPSANPFEGAPVVVVIDDDPVLRRTLVRALGESHKVYEASDGDDALRLLALVAVPDVLVCDVSMPGLDGLELARRVRRLPALKRVPILFLTGRRSPQDIVQGINVGARHYVTKPFDVANLVAKVSAMTRRPYRD